MKLIPGVRKVLTLCLTLTIIATYSMVTLANAPKVAGELRVAGKAVNGAPFAIVNGEAANSGRSIFSSSTVATPEGVTATLNLGKAGVLEIAPNSSVSVSFDAANITGSIASGSVKVISAANSVQFTNAAGQVAAVNAGQVATAAGQTQDDDDDDNDAGSAWWLWALVIGGATAGFVWAATSGSNDVSLGGGGTVISPTR